MSSGSVSPARLPPKIVRLLMELRAPFFTGSLVPVLVGTALAFQQTGNWDWPLFLGAMAGMIFLHAGANVLNDYFDHRSGNDERNTEYVRPFTGGSRMIQNGWLTPGEVLGLALGCLAAGLAVGAFLTLRLGFPILILGTIGLLIGALYSAPRLSLAARGIGEPAIGLSFGVLPVLGAHFVQTRHFSWDAAGMGLPTACLITAVLFINQFQDARADAAAGKRHWVVRLGRRRAVWVYAALMALWPVPIAAAVLTGRAPALVLLALLPLPLAAKAVRIARRQYDQPRALTPANGLTIAVHLASGLLLSAALVVSRWLPRW